MTSDGAGDAEILKQKKKRKMPIVDAMLRGTLEKEKVGRGQGAYCIACIAMVLETAHQQRRSLASALSFL